ncbi:putative ferric-chelate reductase (NADH) [Helianthus annuus]|nr:putative ferric-chelate reductase (NADH) [Helianthus annuus]
MLQRHRWNHLSEVLTASDLEIPLNRLPEVIWNLKVQNLELDETGEIESCADLSVVETTSIHFGHRPGLKNTDGEQQGKLRCGSCSFGPRKMRHEVAKICSSKQANNLHLESMSFNWR